MSWADRPEEERVTDRPLVEEEEPVEGTPPRDDEVAEVVRIRRREVRPRPPSSRTRRMRDDDPPASPTPRWCPARACAGRASPLALGPWNVPRRHRGAVSVRPGSSSSVAAGRRRTRNHLLTSSGSRAAHCARRVAAPGLGCRRDSNRGPRRPVSGGTAWHNRDRAPPGNSERSVRVGRQTSSAVSIRKSPESTNGEQRDPGPKARHDPGLRRGEPDHPGHRHRGRALPCGPDQDPERDGYAAVQLAFGETKAHGLSKPSSATSRRRTPTPRSISPSSVSTTCRASSSVSS